MAGAIGGSILILGFVACIFLPGPVVDGPFPWIAAAAALFAVVAAVAGAIGLRDARRLGGIGASIRGFVSGILGFGIAGFIAVALLAVHFS
jgi:hypothetical protein